MDFGISLSSIIEKITDIGRVDLFLSITATRAVITIDKISDNREKEVTDYYTRSIAFIYFESWINLAVCAICT